jgi:hypothetical protein
MNLLPLPGGERVGVRGFGRFRKILGRPNPLILSFSPLGRRDAASLLQIQLSLPGQREEVIMDHDHDDTPSERGL